MPVRSTGNIKYQRPNFKQSSNVRNSKFKTKTVLDLERFDFVCYLMLGIWCFQCYALVLAGCAENLAGLSKVPKLEMPMLCIGVVEERFVCGEVAAARRDGAYRSENVGMSNLQCR